MAKYSFFVLTVLLISSCNSKAQSITKEEFYQYAKEHGYIINGGDTTTNPTVLNILKNKKLLKPNIDGQARGQEVDSVSYYNICRLLAAAYPNTSTEDIKLMAKMIYLHGPIALFDQSSVYARPEVPFFLTTVLGNPIETTWSVLQAEFDPYLEIWLFAREHNIPYNKLYFSKLGEGKYELVCPLE